MTCQRSTIQRHPTNQRTKFINTRFTSTNTKSWYGHVIAFNRLTRRTTLLVTSKRRGTRFHKNQYMVALNDHVVKGWGFMLSCGTLRRSGSPDDDCWFLCTTGGYGGYKMLWWSSKGSKAERVAVETPWGWFETFLWAWAVKAGFCLLVLMCRLLVLWIWQKDTWGSLGYIWLTRELLFVNSRIMVLFFHQFSGYSVSFCFVSLAIHSSLPARACPTWSGCSST